MKRVIKHIRLRWYAKPYLVEADCSLDDGAGYVLRGLILRSRDVRTWLKTQEPYILYGKRTFYRRGF